MKKVLAFVLSLCLLLGLTACGAPIEVKKFADEAEMREYLQGVWGNYDKTELYFFSGEKLYLDESLGSRIEYSFEDSLEDIVKEEGYAAVSVLAVKEHVAELEKEWLTYGKDYECNPKKGTLTYQYDGSECVIYVGDGILYDEYDYIKIEKISDTPSYAAPGLIEKFEEALKNYAPEAKDVKLSNKQYAAALMELHPEMKNYPLAMENDGFYLYSDTGKGGNNDYNAALMWSDNSVLLTKRAKGTDTYKVYLTESSLLIQDKHHRESWETLIADALALFGGVPGLPTPQELVAEFREKGENYILNPSLFEYTTEIGGITFEMDESFSANNNSKLLILRFK